MQAPVLILGASGTLGGAIAMELSNLGHALVLHGNQNAAGLNSLLDVCTEAEIITADLTDEGLVHELFSNLGNKYSCLSGVVFCVAKKFSSKLTHRTSWNAFEEQIDSQLKTAHLCLSAAQPLLKAYGETGTARVLIISTEYTLGQPPIKNAPYVAAKAALNTYAQVIAQEWLGQNIRVQIMAPGMIPSNLTSDLPDMYLEQVAEGMPEKCLTKLEDVTKVAGFLMSEAADTLYGTIVPVTRGVRKLN